MPDDDERAVLAETLDALEIPRHGLRKWFAHHRRFCARHGGRRVYGELLALLDRADAALDELEEEAAQSPKNVRANENMR